jgi:hypothetical protein
MAPSSLSPPGRIDSDEGETEGSSPEPPAYRAPNIRVKRIVDIRKTMWTLLGYFTSVSFIITVV